jgi:hypothetical protein
MAELSFHLFDHVVPKVPLRQYVLTLPVPLRILVARDKQLLSAVRAIFQRTIARFTCRKVQNAQGDEACKQALLPAGLCVVQRFGSALQLAPHFHALLFDGVYHRDDDGRLHFLTAPAVATAERLTLTTRIAKRIERLLLRRGLQVAEQWSEAVATTDDEPMQQLTLEAMKVPVADHTDEERPPNASAVRGFNLHCQTRVTADDEAGRMRLFRYVLRPAIAQDRLSFDAGVVRFEMKRAFANGARVLTFTPQQFIRRIALLVPPPRHHEVTYFGVLAANAKYRTAIVPVPTFRRRPKATMLATTSEPCLPPSPDPPGSRLSWADLIEKTFLVDVLLCPVCAGRARIIAVITEPATIHKILTHLFAIQHQGDPAIPRAPPSQPANLQ